MGGFGDEPGHFRAIESIRAPLQEEFYAVNLISGVLFSGLAIFLTLFLFNGRLQKLVKLRTEELEEEVATRKKVEMQVRKLNEELEEKVAARTIQLEAANKELDAFAYSVSHDLRAPLRGIDGFSQALLEDYGDRFDEQGKDYINRVRTGCFRMGNLIDDMLKLSRLSRGEIDKKPVNLSEIAVSIAEDLQRTLPDRRVKFVIAPGIVASGDATLLRAVMENLLGNAWKFTGKTEDAIIEFGAVQEEGRTLCFVRDNGAGFNMDYADKLFAPFQRLHSVNEFAGSGIGLATVKRILHRHGGDIRGEGMVGQGATFYFWLELSSGDRTCS
jgi:light-regulated signal transduction histidine kinase (bacteriophytochrome)